LFNSHLFDFVQGWIYVLGVGVAGGTVLRHQATESMKKDNPTAKGGFHDQTLSVNNPVT
jgi:hypothetical protein